MDDKQSSETSERFEILVGLHVIDDPSYDQYRAGMTPILEALGGYFRFDFRVSEMLKGDADDPFNRVFIISFPNKETQDRFFADSDYKEIRDQYYAPAVRSGGVIASFTSN